MSTLRFAGQKRPPDERRLCALCSHTRSSAVSRAEKVQVVWINPDGSETCYCHHCGARTFSASQLPKRAIRTKARRGIDNALAANWLWQTSRPIKGTPGETYFREGRGITCPLPSTLRYVAPRKDHPHMVVAPFSGAIEAAPGELQAPRNVAAIHRTFLSPDGLSRTGKKMLGACCGKPIVLAPPNDCLGLTICEGIEDALSVHAATGLGAWAAGSAARLTRLAPAVPSYIEHIMIVADDDPSGRINSQRLAEALAARAFEVTVKTLSGRDSDG